MTTLDSSDYLDWEKTVQQQRNETFARLIVPVFAEELRNLQTQMNDQYAHQDLEALKRTIHHIHGACCFCSSPMLEKYSSKLNRQLEQNDDSKLKEHIEQLNDIISHVLKAVKPYINAQ